MEIKTVPIESIFIDPANARKHPQKNMDAIKGSISKFQQVEPLVVQKSKKIIIGGNGRYQAMKELGFKEVQIVEVDLTDTQAAALAISLNRTGELAEWDLDVLPDLLLSLQQEDFDLASIGFDDDDLNAFIPEEIEEGKTDPDAVPENVETRCKPGDLWILGNHRLLCGDSTNVPHVELLMNGEKADMVFTDPPYGMSGEMGGSNDFVGKAAKKLGDKIRHLCDFDPENFLNTLPVVFEKNKMNAYIFCNKDLVPKYLNWGVNAGYSFNILFWKKPNAIPLGGSHRPDVEYLLLFRKGAIWNNAVEGCSYSRCLDFPRELSKDHPTLKPVALIENELKISSNQKSIVSEFFLGSGSTLIACEKTGRKCYGIEIDPKYCDVILKRWEDFTGQTAVLCKDESAS